MPKPKVIAKWIEMSQGIIHDKPPKPPNPTLFINHVELRERDDGKRYLMRSTGCEFLEAANKEEMERKVAEYIMREDVRLLAKGIESNDFDALPKRVDDPSDEIINGTDDIYHVEDEPAT